MHDNVTLHEVITNRCVAMNPTLKAFALPPPDIFLPATVKQEKILLTKRFFIGAQLVWLSLPSSVVLQ